jgi:hypothetical protein
MNRPMKSHEVTDASAIELPLISPTVGPDAATLEPDAASASDDGEFDWFDANDCIVLREQPATAIYVNKSEALVIRQEKSWDRDEDSFIYIRPEYAIGFAKRLLKVAGHGEVEFSQRAGGGFVDLA